MGTQYTSDNDACSEIGELKRTARIENNLVGLTEEEETKHDELQRSVYQNPVGNVGYCFQKRFHRDIK